MIAQLDISELPSGTMIDHFKVLSSLGSGGYGAVHKVEKNGRPYALKLALMPEGARDDKQTHARTVRELLCLLMVDHPNIVRPRGYGLWNDEGGGRMYLVLDFHEGGTLGEWCMRTHPTFHELIGKCVTVADAVSHLNERGLFHRDLKHSNVVMSGADGEPILIDLGVADFHQAPDLTGPGLPPGTPRSRSPEANSFLYENRHNAHARYEYKVADEVFAFGVMLYDLLTDPRPTEERELPSVNAVMVPPRAPEEINPRIPPALASLVKRCLARNPAWRPPSLKVIKRELEELLGHQGEEYRALVHPPSSQVVEFEEALDPRESSAQGELESPPAPATPPEAPRGRERKARALAGVAGLVALAFVAFQTGPWGGTPAPVPSLPAVAQQVPASPPPVSLPAPEPQASASSAATSLPGPRASGPIVSDSPQKESPTTMKRARSSSPECATQQVPTFTRRSAFRQWCRSTGVLGTALAVCAGCPGAQRYPESGQCPISTLTAMQEHGIYPGDTVRFTFSADWKNPQEVDLYTGKVRAVALEPTKRKGSPGFPPGALLFGQVWTTTGLKYEGVDAMAVRFDRMLLPDGPEFPVCIVIGDAGLYDIRFRDGGPTSVTPESEVWGTVVRTWPDLPANQNKTLPF